MPQVGMAEAQGIRQGGNANSSALAEGASGQNRVERIYGACLNM
eukprot:CAMPEP_0204040146 /NCGR_PEP_ID=MMETSP0360-20130528/91874_1 /ASSEMBLY_ACC=CAM_ASM_000342 /TAXON_ID=268821 /ORGANISM="Scrippsiella Hangoei, Strain SHTV-5" /LENGTH=43 /DNA_ID= /DNA_START= /DNA_END= /DNA_ORIENTATION=